MSGVFTAPVIMVATGIVICFMQAFTKGTTAHMREQFFLANVLVNYGLLLVVADILGR